MHWQQLINLFVEQIKETSPLEWVGVGMGIAEVLLARINNVWLYPTGILSILFGTYIFFNSGLFAECLLNMYYLAMSLYGWYYWIKKVNKPPVKVSWSNTREWAIAISLIGWVILYFILKYKTTSTVPVWDAFVSSTAWAGMWLLARRKIENWLLLNLSNIFAIPLLFYKKLPLYGALTIFLFIIGVWGFIDWVMIYNKERSAIKTVIA
jgi:nicotinamide mononucleotide transporter